MVARLTLAKDIKLDEFSTNIMSATQETALSVLGPTPDGHTSP